MDNTRQFAMNGQQNPGLTEKEIQEIQKKLKRIPVMDARISTILLFTGGQFVGMLAVIITLILA